MKRWVVACGMTIIAVEVALILIYKIPIYFPYKIDWPIFLKKMLGY